MDTDGLCQCGCGQLTNISDRNHKRFGYIKGQPRRYLMGHRHRRGPMYGRIGPDNPRWQGDNASYNAIHRWISYHWERLGVCEQCGRESDWTDWSNIDHQYRRAREYWRELCRFCHRKHDKTLVTNRRET